MPTLGGEDKQYNKGYYYATQGNGPGARKTGPYETQTTGWNYNQTIPRNVRAKKAYEDMGLSMNPDANGFTSLGYDPSVGAYRTADSLMNPSGMPPTTPMPTNNRDSAGGGGAANRSRDFAAYAAAMLKLINNNPLSSQIAPAIANDIADAKAAYASAAAAVPNNNPYLKLLAMQPPTVAPSMEQYLQSQGVGVAPYQSAVQNQNAQLAANSQNWQGLAQTLGATQDASRQRLLDLLSLQGTNAVQGLQAQQSSLEAAAAAQRQQQLMALMQAALQYGAPMPKVA